jgi:uncharacterized protein
VTTSRKSCVVAYATREKQYVWTVGIALEGTIAEAIEAARAIARKIGDAPDVPWDEAPVGIFGELRKRTDRPLDGDRIELYRPLHADPRERRRQEVRGSRKR